MKTYYFNVKTDRFSEIKINASNLPSALESLLSEFLSNKEL